MCFACYMKLKEVQAEHQVNLKYRRFDEICQRAESETRQICIKLTK